MTVRLALRASIVALVGAGAAAVASDGLCLFAACTGVACPGCGMTRAAGRLAVGDVAGSVAYHPLLIPVLVVGVVWAGEVALARWLDRRPRHGPRLGIALAVAIPVVWVVRAVLGLLPPV